MKCQSCNKDRHKLKVVYSDLLPGITFNLCDTCSERNYEPKWAIVVAARSYGVDVVTKHIKQRKYVGSEITLNDVIV